MLTPDNVINIIGGLVADPESPTANIVKLRIGVDYAGSEKNSDNNSGYFDITYFTNNDTSNAKFVARQVSEGKLKKGSRVHVLGRLVQERWEGEKGKGQRVVIYAEALSYVASARPQNATTDTPNASVASADSVPSSF